MIYPRVEAGLEPASQSRLQELFVATSKLLVAKGVRFCPSDITDITGEGEPVYNTLGTQYGAELPAQKLPPYLRREAAEVLGLGIGDNVILHYSPAALIDEPPADEQGRHTRMHPFCAFNVYRSEPELLVQTVFTVHGMPLGHTDKRAYLGETETFFVAPEEDEPSEEFAFHEDDGSVVLGIDADDSEPDEIEFAASEIGGMTESITNQQAFTLKRVVWLANRWSRLRGTNYMLETRLGRGDR